MSNENPTTLALTLGKADVERIITETVRTQVALALSKDGDGIVEKVVSYALMQKTDSKGMPTTSSYDAMPMVQRVIHEQLQKATRQAVIDWCETNRAEFHKVLIAQIKKSTPRMADSMIEAFLGTVKEQYRMQITIGIPKER